VTPSRLAVTGIAIGTAAIGVAYGAAFQAGGAPVWAAWVMATGTTLVLVALMLLGMARSGRRLGWLWGVLAFTAVVCLGGFGLALALPPDVAGGRLIAGLPPRAAAVLYGVGFLPLAVLPLAYALSFDRQVLTPDDLAHLRATTTAPAAHEPPAA
jgi:predicted cobalt transporter CbtA